MLLVSSIINRSGLVAFTLTIVSTIFAQENSPYSRYGLGDLYPAQHISSRAMGGLSTAFVDGQAINSANPATYGELRSFDNGGLVTFELGISIDARTLHSSSPVTKYNSTNFIPSYIQLGFPLSKKKLGLVFGLKPLSRINYSIEELSKISVDSVQRLYQGNGGLNQVFIGLGKKWKSLSLGFNTGLNFGRKETSTKVNIIDTMFVLNQSNSAHTTNFKGVFLNGGLQYNVKLNEHTDEVSKTKEVYGLRLGLSGTLQQKLNANSENLNETFNYNADGQIIPVDTVSYTKNESGKIDMPSSYTVGFMFTKAVFSSLISEYKWMLGAEYSATNWASDYRYYSQPDKLINSSMIRIGGQLTPNPINGKS